MKQERARKGPSAFRAGLNGVLRYVTLTTYYLTKSEKEDTHTLPSYRRERESEREMKIESLRTDLIQTVGAQLVDDV